MVARVTTTNCSISARLCVERSGAARSSRAASAERALPDLEHLRRHRPETVGDPLAQRLAHRREIGDAHPRQHRRRPVRQPRLELIECMRDIDLARLHLAVEERSFLHQRDGQDDRGQNDDRNDQQQRQPRRAVAPTRHLPQQILVHRPKQDCGDHAPQDRREKRLDHQRETDRHQQHEA
jgi:hypothetical protein